LLFTSFKLLFSGFGISCEDGFAALEERSVEGKILHWGRKGSVK